MFLNKSARARGYDSCVGFTLIELLVVVLIVGVLAAVALPQYEAAVWKSRYATLMSNTRILQQALEVYYMANGSYPIDTLHGVDISALSGCVETNGAQLDCGNSIYDYHNGNASELNQPVCGKLRRKGEHYMLYCLDLDRGAHPGRAVCMGMDDLAEKVCRNLGGQKISPSTYILP